MASPELVETTSNGSDELDRDVIDHSQADSHVECFASAPPLDANATAVADPEDARARGTRPYTLKRRRPFFERWCRWFAALAIRRAFRCLERGRPKAALRILAPLADVLPHITSVRIWLARVALANFDPVSAAEAIQAQYVDCLPDMQRHFCRLAALNLRMENFDAAERYLEMELNANPASYRAWCQMSGLSLSKNDVERSSECLLRAAEVAKSPEQKRDALISAGTARATAGQREEAALAFRAAIEYLPSSFAYCGLVDAQKDVNADHPLIDTIRQLLADPAVKGKGQLHFAMANAYERSGNTSAAFSHFALANNLSRQRFAGYSHNPEAECDERREFFTQSVIDNLSRYGCHDEFLICVVGMPRSGTTLMEQILSAHSQVRGLGERGDFFQVARRLARDLKHKRGYPQCCKSLTGARIAHEAQYVRERLRIRSAGRHRCVTKLPSDAWEVGLIKILFPRAKIIHMMRDPIDTCWSCFMQNFAQVHYAADLSSLLAEYKGYRRIMRHWHEVLPEGAILDVSYETLVAEPDKTIRDVLRFSELEYEESCMEFHCHERPVLTASQYQVREPIYKTSVRRSAPYGEYLGVLAALEKDAVEDRHAIAVPATEKDAIIRA